MVDFTPCGLHARLRVLEETVKPKIKYDHVTEGGLMVYRYKYLGRQQKSPLDSTQDQSWSTRMLCKEFSNSNPQN